jgi:hypothetical protein
MALTTGCEKGGGHPPLPLHRIVDGVSKGHISHRGIFRPYLIFVGGLRPGLARLPQTARSWLGRVILNIAGEGLRAFRRVRPTRLLADHPRVFWIDAIL